jgi:hypothetical protein
VLEKDGEDQLGRSYEKLTITQSQGGKKYTVQSKYSQTEFLTAFLLTPSTGLRLNYVVETVPHKSANWR